MNNKDIETHSYIKNKEQIEFNLDRSSEANYRQFRFRNILIAAQFLLIVFLVAFIVYDKTNDRIYVTVGGQSHPAMSKIDGRSEPEIYAFIEKFLHYLIEYSRQTYVEYRKNLIPMVSSRLIKTIEAEDNSSVTATAVLASDEVQVRFSDFVIEKIEPQGNLFKVNFTAKRTIKMPDGSEVDQIKQQAEVVVISRSLENPFGLRIRSLMNSEDG